MVVIAVEEEEVDENKNRYNYVSSELRYDHVEFYRLVKNHLQRDTNPNTVWGVSLYCCTYRMTLAAIESCMSSRDWWFIAIGLWDCFSNRNIPIRFRQIDIVILLGVAHFVLEKIICYLK